MMDLFVNVLKGQLNSLNIILLVLVVALVFLWKGRRRIAWIVLALDVLIFTTASTAYFPQYMARGFELSYPSFQPTYAEIHGPALIHVLGGGYVADPQLPSTSQLSTASLGRLVEGIRVSRFYNESILVVSGNVASGNESQAATVKKAAIDLGYDPSRIVILDKPSTTKEEAAALAEYNSSKFPVIIVTDAIHMPRAMRFFNATGLEVYAAPTNYIVKWDDNPFALRWLPSAENFLLTDRLIREWAGILKGKVSN